MIEFSNYFTDYRYYYDEYGRKTFYFPSVTTGTSPIKNEYENGVKYYDG